MTHKRRMEIALDRGIPDRVPTTELEFQLPELLCGKKFLCEDDLKGKTQKEIDYLIDENVDYMLEVYGKLDYDAFGIHYLSDEHVMQSARRVRQVSGDEYMIFTNADGTFALPDGDGMYDFAYRMMDDPQSLHDEAERGCLWAIDRNRKLVEAGFDCLILCSDYCFNNGPFLSPKKFAEYITPYLYRIVEDGRKNGAYVIKHTDGNIMPIIDQMVSCHPHALHSIDPMAGVDIKEVKEKYGDQVALCGNVNCALMQTGTEEEIRESARYALKYAKPGGGYVYCTSNIPFRGLPLERYQIVLDEWKKGRDY